MSAVPTPLIAAHRGASKAQRENTVSAFETAVAMGADMIELDVRWTADKQLVVHHDPVIEGLGPICKSTAAELPKHVPTLDAALDACGLLQVNVEIKSDPSEPDYDPDHGLTRAVMALLATDLRRSRYIVSSFDRAVIDLVRERLPTMATGFLYSFSARPGKLVDMCVRDGHVALHPHHVALTRNTVRMAREADLAVNTWTVDDPGRMRTLAAWGVSTIITNVPDVARATFEELPS
jgi:glycerophosphoryl diester phosphodiesterase